MIEAHYHLFLIQKKNRNRKQNQFEQEQHKHQIHHTQFQTQLFYNKFFYCYLFIRTIQICLKFKNFSFFMELRRLRVCVFSCCFVYT